MSARQGIKVKVFSLNKKYKVFEPFVKETARFFLDRLKKKKVGLEIYLAGGPKMLFLNKKFRGENSSANVLSFGETRNFIEPPNLHPSIGEIYLNIPQLEKEKPDFRQFVARRLIIHSLLHLLGYTHDGDSDIMKMEAKEKQLLRYAENYNQFRHRFRSNKRSGDRGK